MRLRNIPGADDAILNSEYCIKNPEEQKGHWQDCFDKVQPLHIEIGMGKGRFIMDMAALHPDINYIGIERYSSVLLRALQKMEQNGYIEMQSYPGDARLKKIVLTEKGDEASQLVIQHIQRMERLLVKDMTADDIDCLFQLTKKIRENLTEDLKCSMKNKCYAKKDNKEANQS